jgi:transcriptional regulator with XRE-family HTH domain
MTSLGNRIKQRRKELKITQAQLAEKIGKAPRTVQDYEADKASPPLYVIDKLAVALETDPFKLLYSDDENPFRELDSAFDKLNEKVKTDMKTIINLLNDNNIKFVINSDNRSITITFEDNFYILDIDDIDNLCSETNKYFKFALNELILEKQNKNNN